MSDQARSLRVLVADDNPVVRAGLSALLGAHPGIRVVAEAPDGAEALTLAARHHPDVILLDARMPGTDGLTALPELSRLAPVLMITYSAEPEVRTEAARRGARGYLVHGRFTTAELLDAVRATAEAPAVAEGPLPLPVRSSPPTRHEPHEFPSHLQPRVAQSSKARFARATAFGRRPPDHRDFGLSSREVEVMDLIASGMNNRQIAATCFISEKTVKNHINRIFAKLHSASRSEAIAHWLGTAHQGRSA
ncbi:MULTISPECIES: response regulator transcription factor [Streptomyces]|uniref:Two component transcriptional regulator, LuxR family n=1 Tax=Streptomyces griseoaurantiacus TaxID=68213 RepID=A0A1G7RZ24_9ACTN|nr:response regulator transcription factor [Streptomyces jietaisiensis]SDG16025.1 two component transcriptional regulator, LuxR family [Streptomyces jietaisiensis]